jgi:hypothetical protein
MSVPTHHLEERASAPQNLRARPGVLQPIRDHPDMVRWTAGEPLLLISGDSSTQS